MRGSIHYLQDASVLQDARQNVRSCRKNSKQCSVGCECTNCSNFDHRKEELRVAESEIAEIATDEEVSNDRRDRDIKGLGVWQ